MLAKFGPSLQVHYCRDLDRVYFGKAPTLGLIRSAYGRNTAESWLEVQLYDLSEFAGCKEKLRKEQISELAAMILEDYAPYKLTEFMLFFQRFKRCEYGKFYGAVDPMVILQALAVFEDDRRKIISRKREEEKRNREEAIDREYEVIKQRYKQRVPDAFTDKAVVTFPQYRLMGYDYMDDATFAAELQALKDGTTTIPVNVRDIYALVQSAFNISDN